VLLGKNVPEPDDVHIPPVAIETEPLSDTVALLAQTVWALPALATGEGVMKIFWVFVTAAHPPLFVEVIVSVTTPALISERLGT
jgi:hypothetical protein